MTEMNERLFQSTLELPFLIKRIREWYHVQVASLCRLPSDTGKYIYQVNLINGSHWILRVGEASVNEGLLQAVMKGYRQYHQLTTNELDYRPDAMRFRSLIFGACSFASAIAQQKSAEFSQWWWKRYCAIEEIADQAITYLE